MAMLRRWDVGGSGKSAPNKVKKARKILPKVPAIAKVLYRLFEQDFQRQAYDLSASDMLVVTSRRTIPQKMVFELVWVLSQHHDLSLVQHADGTFTIWSDTRRSGRQVSVEKLLECRSPPPLEYDWLQSEL